jgi:TRAP-type C4-dicarboxylate transport system permease small subunit
MTAMLANTKTPPNGTRPPAGAYPVLRRAIDVLDGALASIGCLMLFLLMFVVVFDVLLRYLLNSPLAWSFEVVSSYLLPGLFFLAVSDTLKAHAHVSVDIVHTHISPRMRYALHALTSLVAAPVFGFIAVVAARRTLEEFLSGATYTSGLELPSWTTSMLLPLGFGLLAIRLGLDAAGYVATLASGREIVSLPPVSGTQEELEVTP